MADTNQFLNREFLFDALMENIADSIYFKDRECRLVRVSRKMAMDLGYEDPEDLVGKSDQDLFSKEFGEKTILDDLRVIDTGTPIVGLIESRRMPNGELNWTSTSKLPIYDKKRNIIGLLGITREINELMKAEQNLQYLATHDLLTGLPNRYLFFDRLERCILRVGRQKHKFGLLYLDLDDFKLVNDQGGHDVGDRVLKMFSERLLESVRASDTVGRMGGDEFAVIIDDVHKDGDVVQAAKKILEALEPPYRVNEYTFTTTASIGISLYPDHASDGASLLKAADHAMYSAKRHKNSVEVFSFPKNGKKENGD